MDTSKEQEIRNWDLSPLQKNIVEFALLKDHGSDIQAELSFVIRAITDTFLTNGSNQEAEAFLWNLWEFLIRLGQSLPKSRNDSLMMIVLGLRNEGKGKITIWGTQYSLWQDLPLLGPCMRDAWIDPTLEIDLKDDAEELTSWLNLNSFAAKLFARGVTDWANLGLWQLRTGLEEPGGPVETRVLVASEWIKESGYRIYKLCAAETDVDDEASIRALAAGPEFHGKPGFSEHRWTFWKTRLGDVFMHPDLANISKELEGALHEINSIERRLGTGSARASSTTDKGWPDPF